jgi:16S rRNA (cytosine967-C5)-methyltransferase
VIRAANREHPADAVLRETLKARHGLLPSEAAQISRAVFAYYRWLGWLERQIPVRQQLEQALGLAEEFKASPGNFADAELVARAVPAWVQTEMTVRPAWARGLQAEPKLWLRARAGQGRALAKRMDNCRVFGEGPLADIVEYLGRQDLFKTEEFHAGEFELQDISSQAVGLACAPKPGETWWDACAGEGGKTLHLSALMENKGLIWASDRAAWRLQKLKRRAARARVFNYRTATWDGGPRAPTRTKFDGVLADAPCSGIGTWQRNPHARWTIAAADVKELGELQKKILAHATPFVKPGGKLFYAVCTLARSETAEVAQAFAQRFPDFEPLPFPNPLVAGSEPAPQLQLAPEQFGGNGMFIAAWVRKMA